MIYIAHRDFWQTLLRGSAHLGLNKLFESLSSDQKTRKSTEIGDWI